MISNVYSWLNSTWSAFIGWMNQISDGLGFDVLGTLVAFTLLSIILSYLILPAIGGSGSSDKASRSRKGKD